MNFSAAAWPGEPMYRLGAAARYCCVSFMTSATETAWVWACRPAGMTKETARKKTERRFERRLRKRFVMILAFVGRSVRTGRDADPSGMTTRERDQLAAEACFRRRSGWTKYATATPMK